MLMSHSALHGKWSALAMQQVAAVNLGVLLQDRDTPSLLFILNLPRLRTQVGNYALGEGEFETIYLKTQMIRDYLRKEFPQYDVVTRKNKTPTAGPETVFRLDDERGSVQHTVIARSEFLRDLTVDQIKGYLRGWNLPRVLRIVGSKPVFMTRDSSGKYVLLLTSVS